MWMGVLGLRGSGVQRALCFSFWEGVRTDISALDAMDWIGIPVAASSAERLLREREKGTEGRRCCVGGYLSIFAFFCGGSGGGVLVVRLGGEHLLPRRKEGKDWMALRWAENGLDGWLLSADTQP